MLRVICFENDNKDTIQKHLETHEINIIKFHNVTMVRREIDTPASPILLEKTGLGLGIFYVFFIYLSFKVFKICVY